MPLRQHHFVAYWNNNCVRKNLICNPNMDVVVIQASQRIQAYTRFSAFNLNLGAIVFAQNFCDGHIVFFGRKAKLLTVGPFFGFVLEETMQKRSMRGINTYFIKLQPIAVDIAFEGERKFARRFKTVERW